MEKGPLHPHSHRKFITPINTDWLLHRNPQANSAISAEWCLGRNSSWAQRKPSKAFCRLKRHCWNESKCRHQSQKLKTLIPPHSQAWPWLSGDAKLSLLWAATKRDFPILPHALRLSNMLDQPKKPLGLSLNTRMGTVTKSRITALPESFIWAGLTPGATPFRNFHHKMIRVMLSPPCHPGWFE